MYAARNICRQMMNKIPDTFLTETLTRSDKPIVLYGMGNGADRIIDTLAQHGCGIDGVFVSDGFVRDKTFHGHKLCSYSDMCARYDDFIVLVSFGTSLPDVMDRIIEISHERELYAPYVPVTGDGDFTREYFESRLHDYEKVYRVLADDLSRRTFEDIISYRITGRTDFLTDCETDTDELYRILSLGDNEVYADYGAYRGDTIAEFLGHVSSYRRIYAAEPDIRTFRKLGEYAGDLPDCVLYNAAAYSHSDGTGFAQRGGRSSSVSDKSAFIPTVCTDDLEISPTYIKMDIEGAESEAIIGSRRTISYIHPKLRISAYHRMNDLLDIPEQVLGIYGGYRLYLRHRPYFPDWDTEFIFV